MTPVQLPEVPAIDRYDVSGGSYPMVRKPEGEYVGYDDHETQLREYATQAVMAERRRVLALAEKWRDLADKLAAAGGDIAIAEAASMRNDAKELECLITPSETNSER